MHREKREAHLNEICSIKENLLEWIKMEMSCGLGGEHPACLDSLGKLTDMVKDLAEAEAECAEACEKEAKTEYYWSIVDAMHGEHENERAGYDHYRYAKTGRFAPTGHGVRSGYSTKGNPRGLVHPSDTMPPHMGRMGYPHDRIPLNYDDPMDPMYGQEHVGGPWYYHEGEEKHHMTTEEKMRHTMDTMKEMWHDADPALKREMKSDMSSLLSDVPV